MITNKEMQQEAIPHIKIFFAETGTGVILIESVITQGISAAAKRYPLSINAAKDTAEEVDTTEIRKAIMRTALLFSGLER